jgi:hypothetical protein
VEWLGACDAGRPIEVRVKDSVLQRLGPSTTVLHADSVEDVGSQEAARLSVDLAATTAIRQAEVGTAKTGVTGVGGSR